MLKEEIEKAKKIVKTDSLQITIGEIASMYESKELDILPDFQRLFRWSVEKKSNFIESIFVGIPIPPAFAYENEDGTWELIDGLQRTSTILEFMGVLRSVEEPTKFLSSELIKTKYLNSLEGAVWSEQTRISSDSVPIGKSLQLFFRRARVDFQVLKQPSSPETKYDLFQRLNRGGAYANEQEVRSCSMILADKNFTNEIRSLARQNEFKSIFQVTEGQVNIQRDIDYAVRLITLTFRTLGKSDDVQVFLDREIISIFIHENKEDVINVAKWTVSLLNKVKGENAFLPDPSYSDGLANRVTLRAFEVIGVGVARNYSKIGKMSDPEGFVLEKIESLWRSGEVKKTNVPGQSGTKRISLTIPLGESWFNPDA